MFVYVLIALVVLRGLSLSAQPSSQGAPLVSPSAPVQLAFADPDESVAQITTCTNATMSTTPSTVNAPGQVATFASGFAAGSAVTIEAAGAPPGGSISGLPVTLHASSSCTVSGTGTIPGNATPGVYTVRAVGQRSSGGNLTLTSSFTVVAPAPTIPPTVPPTQVQPHATAAPPSVVMSPLSGPPGTFVTVTITYPHQTVCLTVISSFEVWWDNTVKLADVQSGNSCLPSFSFTVPHNATPGPHSVSLGSMHSAGTAIGTFTVTGSSSISTSVTTCPAVSVRLGSSRINQGGSTTLLGRGFAPGSRANVQLQGPGGATFTQQIGPANSSCEITGTITLQPTDPVGSYTVFVTGSDVHGSPLSQSAFLEVTSGLAPAPPADDVQPTPTLVPTATATLIPSGPVAPPPAIAPPPVVVRQNLRLIGGSAVPIVGQPSDYEHEVVLDNLPLGDLTEPLEVALAGGGILRIAALQGAGVMTMEVELASDSMFLAQSTANVGQPQLRGNTLVLDVPLPVAQPPRVQSTIRQVPQSAGANNPVRAVRTTFTAPGGQRVQAAAPAGPVLPPELRYIQPPRLPVDPTTGDRLFPETGFAIADDNIWNFYHRRGGARTFGAPLSRLVLLNGAWVQLFERGMLQVNDDGQVVSVNLLEGGYLPYEAFGDLTLPPVDEALIAGAPDPSEPDFGARSQEFVRANAPDDFDGANPRFYTTFLGTVGFYDAFFDGQGDPALVPGFSLEIWGLPTGAPTYQTIDGETDPNTILMRFQRGVMAHDRSLGTTRRVELGYYLRSVLIGDDSQVVLAAAALGNPLWAQYNPEAADWTDRPSELLETNLVLGFTRDDTGEEAVVLPVRTPLARLLVDANAVVFTDDGEPSWIARPGESYQVLRQEDDWVRVIPEDGSGRIGWLLLNEAVRFEGE
jgi:hypothetical protein